MKAFFLTLFTFLLVSGAGAYEIFFVPGWNTGYHNREGCVVRLQKVYPNIPIKVKSWNSKVNYFRAEKNAEQYSRALMQEVINMPENRRRNLILIGHSLGGKIVINVLNELVNRGMHVHEVVLLGAAIRRDDPAIRRSLFAVRTRILNLYNPDDALLRVGFCIHSALGTHSWSGTHPRFFERRSEKRRLSPYNHYAYLYIEDLLLFVRALPPLYSNIHVPGEVKGAMTKVSASDIYWRTSQEYCHWLLQHHYLGKKFRIVDPWDRLRFESSDAAKAQASFNEIRRQLEALGAK